MRLFLHPFFLAAALTLLNAAKPPAVDDTAYLLFARNIAAQPLNPYGYELFWFDAPEPAFGVLATPAVPYWLALGITLFGENWFLLKLWLFPFALILAFAVRSLGRRFAAEAGPWFAPAVVLGPGVLPFFNLMLDVPTLALQLAAVAVFLRGGRRNVIYSGLLAGLAMQAKYTAFVTPGVFVLWAISRRASGGSPTCATSNISDNANESGSPTPLTLTLSPEAGERRLVGGDLPPLPRFGGEGGGEGGIAGITNPTPLTLTLSPEAGERGLVSCGFEVLKALAATLGAVAVFAAWELFLFRQYGESHFLHHAAAKSEPLDAKFNYILPLLGQFGAIAGWAGCAGWAAVRFPGAKWFSAAAAVLLAVLCLLPFSFGELRFGGSTANGILFTVLGGSAVTAAFVCGKDSRFLLAWLAMEVVVAVVLTSFPAGRRLLGVGFVVVLIVARKSGVSFRPWAGVAVVCGLLLAALDTFDAWVEPAVADRAGEAIPFGSVTYCAGHWGWQYTSDRRGWKALTPGAELPAGSYLVLPVPPGEDRAFFRPHVPWPVPEPPADVAEVVTIIAADDRLPVSTLPNLYTGAVPVGRRSGPRMVVVVYRVLKPWRPIQGAK